MNTVHRTRTGGLAGTGYAASHLEAVWTLFSAAAEHHTVSDRPAPPRPPPHALSTGRSAARFLSPVAQVSLVVRAGTSLLAAPIVTPGECCQRVFLIGSWG